MIRNGSETMFYGGLASYVMLIPALLLSLYASSKVKSTFNKYNKVGNNNGYTGRDIAEKILQLKGVYDVQIEHVQGNLSDHYDPRTKTLRLSDSVYDKATISAVSVAAHECGHALQDQDSYVFLTIRHAIVPLVNIVNQAAMPLIILGIFLGGRTLGIGSLLIQLGIIFFSGVVIFQLVTLPVEFNASSRALDLLEDEQYLDREEMQSAKRVLNAAALTYVAAAASAALSLIRLLLIFGGGRND